MVGGICLKRSGGLVIVLLRFVGYKVLHLEAKQRRMKVVMSCSAPVWIPKRLTTLALGTQLVGVLQKVLVWPH